MKKIIISLLALLLLFIIGSTLYGYKWYYSCIEYASANEASIEIREGDGISEIGQKLYEKNIINSTNAFLLYAFINDGRTKILPGIHHIPSQQTIPQLLELLQTNPNREVTITFPEGLTGQDILDKITASLPIQKGDLSKVFEDNNWSIQLPFGKDISNNPEGFLFPDTYRFQFQSTPTDIIDRFVDNFNQKWQSLNHQKEQPYKLSDYEILILASIIEKEANSSLEEKKIISGIFYNRLLNNESLGANSTLNYILPEAKRVFTDKEINHDSPYNTYLNKGLPPTPICNPGLDSLKAALEPENTDFYYFLHSSTGETYFATTYEEHQKNIAKYL